MNKYIIRFEKLENLKYVSHLDFLRFIQRAMRRAGIPLSYSKGFNPHPIISFALPLAVGVSGLAELFEIGIEAEMDPEEIKNKINTALVPGLKITEVTKSEGNNFSKIRWALYKITPENMPSQKQIEAFLSLDEITAEKNTKKGIKTVSVKEDIFSIEINDNSLMCILSAGAERNIKPSLFAETLKNYIPDYDPGYCTYLRIKLLDDKKIYI